MVGATSEAVACLHRRRMHTRETGDTGERIGRESEQRTYTEEVRDLEVTKEMEVGGMGGCMRDWRHWRADRQRESEQRTYTEEIRDLER